MKTKKAVVSLFLALSVLCGIPSGCTAKPGAAKSGEETKAADGALDTSKEVNLVMYVISDRPAGQDAVDQNFNKLAKEKLNCTLTINWIPWADYANKYPLLFSSGETFDMAYSATWLNFASMAQKGAFMSLDELWPKYAPKNYAAQSEAALQQAKVNGHYYCVPTLLSTYNAYGPIYRTDIMKDTGWNGKMETFADVEAYLDIVKKTQKGMEPIDIYSAGSEWDDTYMYLNGYRASKGATNDFLFFKPSESSPKLISYYECPQVNDFLSTMTRWNEKGFFTKSALSDTDSTKLQNGKAAMRTHNIDTFSGYAVMHPEYGLQYANLVKHVAHMPYTQDTMVISNTSQNPERSLALWDLITNDRDTFDTFMYGVKDTTYTLNDKGQYKLTDTNKYATSAMWAARTTKLNRDAAGTPDSYENCKKAFESSIASDDSTERYAGFTIDTSKIETEYAACQNVHQQYWWPLELGYTDAKTGLAEYRQKMEAAGIEKVRSALQKQLDEYTAGLKK